MLAPLPSGRPQSAEEVLARLRALPGATCKTPVRSDTTLLPKTVLVDADPLVAEPPVGTPPPTQDQQRAFEACRQRAERGECAAQYELALMFAQGRGTARDEQAARAWLEKAAAQGYVPAQRQLGLILARGGSGPGEAKDETAAADWLRRAAEQGDAVAQFNLAVMYAHGIGVAPDRAQALHGYRLAARQGHPGARANLAVLEGRPGYRRWLYAAVGLLAALVAWIGLRRLLR